MSYPKTANEWWDLANRYKAELRDLVAQFYPVGKKSSPDYAISAAAAEAGCEAARAQFARVPCDPLALYDQAHGERNGELLSTVLSATWFGLPESMASRDLPGFAPLCTLCSEAELVVPGGFSDDET